MKVEFIPKVSDYMFISEILYSGLNQDSFLKWLYSFFLFTNAIGFPAYLLLKEKYIFAFGIFLFNILAYFFLTSVYWKNRITRSYSEKISHLLDSPLQVELTHGGIFSNQLGNSSIAIWANVTDIRETEESVYFFYRHNATFVRKEAFDTQADLEEFVTFAKQRINKEH